MFDRMTGALVASALALAACAPTTEVGPRLFVATDVPHPEALFSVSARNAIVSQVSGGTGIAAGTRICPRLEQVPSAAPLAPASIAAVRGPAPEYSSAPRDFARAINQSAFASLLDNDAQRAAADVALLRAHANADAWVHTPLKNASAGAVIAALGPLLPAWHVLRQASTTSDADRAAIDGWLARLGAVTDRHTGTDANQSARAANDMMLGLMLGDRARYDRGRAGFRAQLAAMRPDGSFPQETSRGATALERQARNAGLLVYAAEIAASQGVDLYAVEVDGKSLHDAVSFTLRAAADNAAIDVYARENLMQDAPFRPGAQADPLPASRGWALLYVHRFPDRPAAQELAAALDLRGRIASDTVGGWVSCYAGDPTYGSRARRPSSRNVPKV